MNRNNKGMILNFEGGANRFEVWRLEDEPVKKSKHFWVPSMWLEAVDENDGFSRWKLPLDVWNQGDQHPVMSFYRRH